MPDENLEFTAVYGKHVHQYASEITKKMTCTSDGVRTYNCTCGDSYEEIITATGHNYEAITPSLEKEDGKCTFCCTNCGDKYEYALNFEIVETTGKKDRVLYEFSLTDGELNTDIQPEGEIQIRIPLSEVHGNINKANVYRYNDDGTKTQVPAVIENDFLVITCEHFTPYEVVFVSPCENHIQGEWVITEEPTCAKEGSRFVKCIVCETTIKTESIAKKPHTESAWVTGKVATCTEEGSKHIECTVCRTIIKSETLEKLDHKYINGVCGECGDKAAFVCNHMCHKSGFMGFLWKIVQFFWKLFKMNPVCDCGAKHY